MTTETTQVRCDPDLPSHLSPVPHDYGPPEETVYGSLTDGGSYEVIRCQVCHRVAYRPLTG